MKAKPEPQPKSGKAKLATGRKSSEVADFSRVIVVEDVLEIGLDVSISADRAEREALAERNGLVSVESFVADFRVLKKDRTQFIVTGVLRAQVTQTCVVSLEPFESSIEAEIDVDFAPPDAAPTPLFARKEFGEPNARLTMDPDAPDPIIDGRIDLGALAAEFLSLSLDPYPRKPGVQFEERAFAREEQEKISPFAALRQLKDKP